MGIRPFVILAGLVFAVASFLDLAREAAAAEQPYRAAPLATQAVDVPLVLPAHSEEIFALCGLAALLFGLRAAGLARQGR